MTKHHLINVHFTISYHRVHKSTTAKIFPAFILDPFMRRFLLFSFVLFPCLPINVLPRDIRQYFFRLLALTAFSHSVHLLHYHHYTLFTHLFENGREKEKVYFSFVTFTKLEPVVECDIHLLKVVITYYSFLHSTHISFWAREDRGKKLSEKKGEEIMKPLLDLCWILFFFRINISRPNVLCTFHSVLCYELQLARIYVARR